MKNKLLFTIIFCMLTHMLTAQTREAVVAGQFYTNNPTELSKNIKSYIGSAEKQNRKPFGLICPHAGYIYSGAVAGVAYNKILNHQYETIIILSPSHTVAFPYASVYNGDYYETPLDKIQIDKKTAQELCTDDYIKLSHIGHERKNVFERGEHAVEVQIPFLQTIYKDCNIVPIVIGTLEWKVLEKLGEKLEKLSNKKDILIIASSDLSHFHNYSECKIIDNKLLKNLKTGDSKSFFTNLVSNKFEACGGGPIVSLLIASGKNAKIDILKYANSGDIPNGNKSQVVGYTAVSIYKNHYNKKEKSMDNNRQLNVKEQKFILELAEETVKKVVIGEKVTIPENIPEIARVKRGAFVTLNHNGHLRGCIGYILPIMSIRETIIEVGTSAAMKDPRFNPVQPTELKNITVEVSVLTVPEIIDDVEEIEVGKHGIIMKRGYYHGLLLPQVATEYGWDRETFLEQTCRKAGLPSDAWKDKKTEIQIFSAQIFSRESLGIGGGLED